MSDEEHNSSTEQDDVNMEEDAVHAGEDALVLVADMLHQKLQADVDFEKYMKDVDVEALADKFRNFLSGVYGENDWPEMSVDLHAFDEAYADFASVLLELMGSGTEGLETAMDKLSQMREEDQRLQRFDECIRSTAIADGGLEDEAGEDGGAEDEGEMDKGTAGQEIDIHSFNQLLLEEAYIEAANDAWKLFISMAASREAAGEAIYTALFESVPSMQHLFTTPSAVQAIRIMNGLQGFVEALTDPARLKTLVETLGFAHLQYDITPARIVSARDAFIDLFMVELAERFTRQAREAWVRLLNYIGGAIIFTKTNYADRIGTLLKSWKDANKGDEDGEKKGDETLASSEEREQAEMHAHASSKKTKLAFWKSSTKNVDTEGKETEHGGKQSGEGDIGAQTVPTTYPEMFKFNAAVMGFGTSGWMNEVLACFDSIVNNVSNTSRFQEECEVLTLRIARVAKGSVNFAEYKSCMLASLRSLLPKDWDTAHEVAWSWLWENVERTVLKNHGQPPIWERALAKLFASLDEEQKFEIRKDFYKTFFAMAPTGQDFFKQSNTYLHFISEKVINMTLEMYQNPVKMTDDLSAVGLRHVGYGIPTELFGPFVNSLCEVFVSRQFDAMTIESFRWSLGLMAKILTRTITEGSTIVMKAINKNSGKLVRKAISNAPRGERSAWMLVVQVGTQSISPLAWSIEAGNFEASTAILQDLLTFRADRDRYYYGVDELFKRHPNIVKMLCDQSPDLIPKLLEGLIWRSRTTENGMRRVNYYVKHVLVDEEGNFSKNLSWITSIKDPKIVCHPVVVLVADIVWFKVAYRTFLYNKTWLFFTLVVFIFSQSILEHLNAKDRPQWQLVVIFICRAFIYMFRMTQFLFNHSRDTMGAYLKKDTIRLFGIIPLPRYFRQWQDMSEFLLMTCLVGMLLTEPILWCWPEDPWADGMMFEEHCEENDSMRFTYTIFTMFATFFYYILLIDLTVISTKISAFALVCLRVLPEVGLFLGALLVTILTFASTNSVLKHEDYHFLGIHKGAYSLVRMFMEAYPSDDYTLLEQEVLLFILVVVFLIATMIFLLNMLIAQMSCAYSSVYKDMVGYARLERAETIVDIMPSVSKSRWQGFTKSLRLHKRLEFNQGDIGVAGGLQMYELASLNPTTTDMIRRFGGSTSPEIQWPEDDAEGDGEDRFEKMEKLITRAMERISKSTGHGTRTMSGTGTSSGQTGSGTRQSSSQSSSEED